MKKWKKEIKCFIQSSSFSMAEESPDSNSQLPILICCLYFMYYTIFSKIMTFQSLVGAKEVWLCILGTCFQLVHMYII